MEDKLYDIPTTKSEAYDFVLNQVVWIEQPVPHILESSNYATMYPVFAKYGVDCKPANLQRLLREAYDRQVAALKSVLSRRKVHLVIDFRRKMTTSYVGITITSNWCGFDTSCIVVLSTIIDSNWWVSKFVLSSILTLFPSRGGAQHPPT